MAYKVIILYQLYMPSYFLGTFTEYPYATFPSDTTDRSFRKSQTTDRSDRAPEHEGTFYFLSILFFKIDRIAIPKFFVSLDILVINPAFNNCRRSPVYTGSDILHRPFHLFPLFFIGIFHLNTT